MGVLRVTGVGWFAMLDVAVLLASTLCTISTMAHYHIIAGETINHSVGKLVQGTFTIYGV